MCKSILLVLAVLALVGCSNSKRTTDAGKLIEARNPDCAAVAESCGLQIGPDGTELRITLPDGSHLSIFGAPERGRGLRRRLHRQGSDLGQQLDQRREARQRGAVGSAAELQSVTS